MTNFTIEQIIALSQAGFSADQINGFAMGQPVQAQPVQPAQTQPVQPVQTQPAQLVQTQPVQTQPVQPVQTQPVQPVQTQPVQAVQTQSVQPVQTQPVQPAQQIPQIPANQAPGGDISGQLLTLIKTIQSQNLANASGQTPTVQTAEDIGLSILGKTGGEN